jgi:hypothetical protein
MTGKEAVIASFKVCTILAFRCTDWLKLKEPQSGYSVTCQGFRLGSFGVQDRGVPVRLTFVSEKTMWLSSYMPSPHIAKTEGIIVSEPFIYLEDPVKHILNWLPNRVGRKIYSILHLLHTAVFICHWCSALWRLKLSEQKISESELQLFFMG